MAVGRKQGRRFEALNTYVKPKAKLVRQSLCKWDFILSVCKTAGLIIFYYTFSISLTFYNQRFIHHFRFPLSITMTHLVTKFIIAYVVRSCMECSSQKERIILSWPEYVKRVAPPGIFSSIDIGLSNWSFEYVTVSLYTMTKSSVIVFILGFSILFRLERPRSSLILVVLFIAAGLFMFTFQSTQFHLEGFLMVLGASFLSGLRWTTAQLVMQKEELGLSNPLDLIYHIQPWMIVALFPLAVGFESLHVATTKEVFGFTNAITLLQNLALLFAGAFVAFFMEFAEFLLLRHTSSLTLSISGIFKEICTLYLAFKINGDTMNTVNAAGLLVCLIGIILHVVLKATSKEKEKSMPQKLDEKIEMLLLEENSEDEEDVFDVVRDR